MLLVVLLKSLANEVGVKTAVLNPIESLTTESIEKRVKIMSVL